MSKFRYLQTGAAAAFSALVIAVSGGAGLAASPQRIVSINLCTDQLIMMLAEPSRIAAVSHLARNPAMSVLAGQAKRFPVTHGHAEEVYLLKPDLVLAGQYTSRQTLSLLRKLGIRVVEVPVATSFDGIVRNITIIGKVIGNTGRAAEIARFLKENLARIKTSPTAPRLLAALYFANGYSSGQGTLINAVTRRSGFDTLGQHMGFHGTRQMPLETLMLSQPDVLVLGLRNHRGEAKAYEIFRHPALRRLKESIPVHLVQDALTICGTPHTLKAMTALTEFRKRHLFSQSGEASHGE